MITQHLGTKAITADGIFIDLLNPKPHHLTLFSLASGLSYCNRYAGQAAHNYNVAQHTMVVASITAFITGNGLRPDLWHDDPQQDLIAAYLHDAPEYILGDPIAPMLNASPALHEEWTRLAQPYHKGFATKFGLHVPYSSDAYPLVKFADRIAGELERRVLFPSATPWCTEEEFTFTVELLEATFTNQSPDIRYPVWRDIMLKAEPEFWAAQYGAFVSEFMVAEEINPCANMQ